MGRITVVPYSEIVENAWNRIFVSNDPFSDPFRPNVRSRLLMYPTYGYYLEQPQYEALRTTIEAAGEDEFFISIVEAAGDFLRVGGHWLCKLSDYHEYRKISLPLENCLYSPRGTFGVIISHEDHALLAGEPEWIEMLKKHYPGWRDDRRRIVEDWRTDLAKPVLDASM